MSVKNVFHPGAWVLFLQYTNACVENMRENHHKVYCTLHAAPGHQFRAHPEAPRRIHSLAAWVDSPPYPEVQWLDYELAKEGTIALVHQISLLTHLRDESLEGPHEFEPSPSYVTEDSYQAALSAVGATLAVSQRILNEGTGRGFAIVRPPGHHAEPDASMGFCLLNNIAVAAADAVASGLARVAILDFDAHHGNGTQAAFWDTPQVGYLSTHEADIYPGTGRIQDAPHARGRIINIPLPAFSSNKVFIQVFEQVVIPWLYAFQPEMIFVSAGFDAHFSDPLTTLSLDTTTFYFITRMLLQAADEICDGRIMYALEGGYDPAALKDNLQACLAAMSDHDRFDDHYGSAPEHRINVAMLIEKLKREHQIKEK